MIDSVHMNARTYFKAFYSSALGGITTEPAFMSVPIDDHMVHRGHGVFDTAIVVRGSMYLLDAHLDRFLASAAAARIPLPCHRAKLRAIILDTAAASGCQNGPPRRAHSACQDIQDASHSVYRAVAAHRGAGVQA